MLKAGLALVLLAAIIVLALFGFEKGLTANRPRELQTPDVTPRAQSEFEAGGIFKAYRAASEAELARAPSIDKVMVWMVAHPGEALK